MIKLVKVSVSDSYRNVMIGTHSVTLAADAASGLQPAVHWSRVVPEYEVANAIADAVKAVPTKTAITIKCDLVGEIEDEYIAPQYRKQ